MISSIRPKRSISAKEMPKNHTDKERFAAASSCFATGILTLLFPAQTTAFLSQSIISHRVLEAIASRILKSLLNIIDNSGPATSRGVLSQLYPARPSAFPSSAPGHVYHFNNCSVTFNIAGYNSALKSSSISEVNSRENHHPGF